MWWNSASRRGVARRLGGKNTELCVQTNVTGTGNVLSVAEESQSKPWVLFSSSREIYGEPERLPVLEDDCPSPVNVYGRSKADAEELVLNARRRGARIAIVRLANVYGSCRDHADRASPAFARTALEGLPLHVYGRDNAFDFTHISDVVQGLMRVVGHLARGTVDLPIIHFATGRYADNPRQTRASCDQMCKLEFAVVESPPITTM